MIRKLFYLAALLNSCWLLAAAEPPSLSGPITKDSARNNPALIPIGPDYSIPIKSQGDSDRTIHIREGILPDDKKNGELVVYPTLCPIPLKSPRPLGSLPEIIWDVEGPNKSGKTGLLFKLLRTSETLQDGIAASVRTTRRTRIATRAVEPKISASTSLASAKSDSSPNEELRVRVQPDSLVGLFFAVMDAPNNVMLGFAEKDIQSEGDAIELWVSMDAASLNRFLELYPQGNKLNFAFAALRYGTEVEVAYQNTAIDIDLGKLAEQVLTSEQQQKREPIMQADEINLKQQLSIRVRRDFSVTGGTNVLSLVGQDAGLLAGLISRHEDLSFSDFQKAFPRYTDTAFMNYLASSLQTVLNSSGEHKNTAEKSVVEIVNLDGGGWGIHAPWFGGQNTSDEHDRTLKMWESVSGTKLERVTKSTFSPHRIKVFHLADGWQTARVTSAGYYALGKGNVTAYVSDTPLPQTLTINTLNAVMQELIVAERVHYSSLEMKRRVLAALRDEKQLKPNSHYIEQRKRAADQFKHAWTDSCEKWKAFSKANSEYDKCLGELRFVEGAISNTYPYQIHLDGRKRDVAKATPARDEAEKALRASKETFTKTLSSAAAEDEEVKSLLRELQELDHEIARIEHAMFVLSK